MPSATAGELPYHFLDRGSGPPLLLLHGFTGSGRDWEPLAGRLGRGRRLISLDLPGHGQTRTPDSPPRTSMAAVTEDIAQILGDLSAVPADILGYSMGGRLALYLALERPFLARSLVLESASPGLATDAERKARRRQDEALARRLEDEGIAPFVAFWESLPIWASQAALPSATRERQRLRRLANDPAGLAASLRGLGTGAQPSLWPRLHELACPVLLLTGAADDKFVAINRQMAGHIPNVRHQIIPDAGHNIHLESPTVFATAVKDFLASYCRL